jgi:hypothetical protein
MTLIFNKFKVSIIRMYNFVVSRIIYFIFDIIINVVYFDKLPAYHYIIIWLFIRYGVAHWYVMVYAGVFSLLQLSISFRTVGNVLIVPFRRYLSEEDFKLIGNPFSALGAKANFVLAKAGPPLLKMGGTAVIADHVYTKSGAELYAKAHLMETFGVDKSHISNYVKENINNKSIIESVVRDAFK